MSKSTAREEFLQETVDYYSADPLKRRNIKNDQCAYASILDHSQGCAIGRHLPFHVALKLDKDGGCGFGVYSEEVEKVLPSWMKDLGFDFLRNVQQLHDCDNFWTETGLFDIGRDRVNEIKLRFIENE